MAADQRLTTPALMAAMARLSLTLGGAIGRHTRSAPVLLNWVGERSLDLPDKMRAYKRVICQRQAGVFRV
jgi:hypothetical protein